MRDRCRSLVGYVPRISGDGRCAEEEAQPRGAALGQGRCRADPPPARLSVWARGREGGHRRRGGEATRACPPALPARRNAGRLLLVEELGQAGRRRHPSAGAPAGGPAAGIALRRVSAAGGRGLAHGSGGDHAGRPLRREARVTAQPSAAAAGGRGHRTSPGGNRAPPAAPPPQGCDRAGDDGTGNPLRLRPWLSPPCGRAAATGRGRPAPHGSFAGGAGGAGGAPSPAPPRAAPAGPTWAPGPFPPSLRRHLPRGRDPGPGQPGPGRRQPGGRNERFRSVSRPECTWPCPGLALGAERAVR